MTPSSAGEGSSLTPRVSGQSELLLALAARCEREEPSGMLDWAIHEMAVETPGFIKHVKPYTTSLDAAVTLVPEGWFARYEPRFWIDGERVTWRAYCIRPKWDRWTPMEDWFDITESEDKAKTPALALCAAALRARAALAEKEGR